MRKTIGVATIDHSIPVSPEVRAFANCLVENAENAQTWRADGSEGVVVEVLRHEVLAHLSWHAAAVGLNDQQEQVLARWIDQVFGEENYSTLVLT